MSSACSILFSLYALTAITLKWREGGKAPCETFRLFDSVVDGHTVYLQDTDIAEVYSYTACSGWASLPDCPYIGSGLVVIDHLLTTVGGNAGSELTNKLFSLRRKCCGKKKWTEVFPPMQTKRREMTALCTGTSLIVAGGIGILSVMLTTVEVMNTATQQWFTAAALPDPICSSSATICGDQIYMLGGQNKNWKETNSVYTCLLSALLQSCSSPSDKSGVWSRVADCPAKSATCVSLLGQMLMIGGRDYEKKLATTAIFMYKPATNSWVVISHMLSARSSSLAAVLPGNRLMVVAGLDIDFRKTATVEFGSVRC